MWIGFVVPLALAAGACSDDGDPLACVDVTAECSPLYPPTFDNMFANTLDVKCGSDSNSCHSDQGMAGGMSFATIEGAFAELLEAGQDRVIPFDPSCSLMIIRTHATDRSVLMPPGSQLSVSERCSLVQWVTDGAPR
jgi:hypothetical protein